MYRQFAPNEALKTDADQQHVAVGLADLAEKHPNAFQHLNKMTVACSKIMEREREAAAAVSAKKQDELTAARAHAEAMRSRFLGMDAQPDSPWMQAPAMMQAPLAAPPPAALPVAVAASAHGMPGQQQQRSVVPDWLRQQIGEFGAGGAGRVTQSDIYSRAAGRPM